MSLRCSSGGATFQTSMLSGIKNFRMGHITLIFGLLVLPIVSCKKDTNKISVSGVYIESSPVAGRSQLNFIKNNLVIKSETGSSFRDSFMYEILVGKIKLTPLWSNQNFGQQFDFEKIDQNTIKIENLYPSIPEAPKSHMIFKK